MNAATLFMVGTGVQAGGRLAGGLAARDAAKFEAGQLERRATEERAAAQRTATERRRETDLVISRATAVGAASGAGTGPSFWDLIGDTAARGEYQAQGETYLGEARVRALQDKASARRFEGRNAFVGSLVESIGGLAVGAGRAASLYGSGRAPAIGPWRTTVSYG
jgi:hypothetical protein